MFGGSEYSDFGKSSSGSSVMNIPEDWAGYYASGLVSYNYSGAYVKSNFQSFFLELGLAFNLSN